MENQLLLPKYCGSLLKHWKPLAGKNYEESSLPESPLTYVSDLLLEARIANGEKSHSRN